MLIGRFYPSTDSRTAGNQDMHLCSECTFADDELSIAQVSGVSRIPTVNGYAGLQSRKTSSLADVRLLLYLGIISSDTSFVPVTENPKAIDHSFNV